jgi:penicillin V acylase-like amidase (Ntn superfamily)
VPTLHLVFHDSTGATLVVQWRDGKMEVLDNPLGVFANDPLLQENLKVCSSGQLGDYLYCKENSRATCRTSTEPEGVCHS